MKLHLYLERITINCLAIKYTLVSGFRVNWSMMDRIHLISFSPHFICFKIYLFIFSDSPMIVNCSGIIYHHKEWNYIGKIYNRDILIWESNLCFNLHLYQFIKQDHDQRPQFQDCTWNTSNLLLLHSTPCHKTLYRIQNYIQIILSNQWKTVI